MSIGDVLEELFDEDKSRVTVRGVLVEYEDTGNVYFREPDGKQHMLETKEDVLPFLNHYVWFTWLLKADEDQLEEALRRMVRAHHRGIPSAESTIRRLVGTLLNVCRDSLTAEHMRILYRMDSDYVHSMLVNHADTPDDVLTMMAISGGNYAYQAAARLKLRKDARNKEAGETENPVIELPITVSTDGNEVNWVTHPKV